MNIVKQSASYAQKNFLSFNSDEFLNVTVNGCPLYQYERPTLQTTFQYSHSEYRAQMYRAFLVELMSSNGPMFSKEISLYSLENEFFSNEDYRLLSDESVYFYKEPLIELENKIYNVYNEHQEKDWDGYEAEPIQYLDQSIRFAEALFSESRLLIESVDIVPENDGCLCFEWFKTDNKFINVSVKNDILIFNYKIGDEKGCGETTFSGNRMLIEQIKKIA